MAQCQEKSFSLLIVRPRTILISTCFTGSCQTKIKPLSESEEVGHCETKRESHLRFFFKWRQKVHEFMFSFYGPEKT